MNSTRLSAACKAAAVGGAWADFVNDGSRTGHSHGCTNWPRTIRTWSWSI